MQMKEYRISDLFEKVEVQKIQGKANDFPTQKDNAHNIPLLTSTGSNQGFSRYAAKEDCPTILQNVISIASNGDAGATFYQAEPFAVLQDAYAIQLKAHKMTETIGLYLAATIRKAIYDTHDWVNKAGWNNIKDNIITLPSVTHIVPDWAMMAQIGGGGKMNNFDTSTWKEFKIGDVLDIRRSNGIFHANAINISDRPFEGSHPYVVRSSKNNGIRGYIKDDEAALNPARTISFAQDTAEMFYQEEAYFTGNNVKVASIKDGTPLNEMSALFIITALRKSMSAFHWGMSFELEKIKDITITLPATETHEPDWNYMQERIAELEQERIAELEQYLIATGLNDYELTEEDKQILTTKLTDGGASRSSESGNGYWKEAKLFNIKDLFKLQDGIKKLTKDNIQPNASYPVYSSSSDGIVGYTNHADIVCTSDIPVYVVFGEHTCTFSIVRECFSVLDNVKVLIPLFTNDVASLLYITSVWKKSIPNLGYARHWKVAQKCKLLIPVNSIGKPDSDFMSKYIHAIEKAVIADVVKYKDEVIANTKIVTQ